MPINIALSIWPFRFVWPLRSYIRGLACALLTAISGTTLASIPDAGFCRVPAGDDIPAIARTERSDWINVKTDVVPQAQGDGANDDTAALQKALDAIGEAPGTTKVVYLPPGKYRITRSLSITKRHGGMLIGHGSDTVIIWDGPTDGRMLWSNGAARQTYDGMIWDGNDKAAVGIDHDSKTLYETRVLHENMEFRNFRTAGIRVGHDQKLASAEMLFSNLKFYRNQVGVLLQEWNDYNNYFDGCHFIENDYGIRAEKGNVNVRNSRFEGSRQSDLYLHTHSHSLRRVVSSNSNAFIRTTRGAISNDLIRVENSRIDGWKNTEGAIISELRGPVMIFDTAFTRPPSRKAPIRLDSPRYMNQIAVLANVSSQGTDAVIDAGLTGIVQHLADNRNVWPLVGLEQTFLRGTNEPVGRILDVKQDCGAAGNGRRDDASAIQRCLDRAIGFDDHTTVYFPSGIYPVSRTIRTAPGARFRIEGTGWHSRVVWSGKLAGTVMHIHDPDGMSVEHLTLGGPSGSVTLHQTGDRPGRVRYHNVFGYYDDETKDQTILFDALPAGTVVLSDHLDGRVTVRESSEATVLIGFLVSVQLIVEGKSPQTGFLGVLGRASALEEYPLVVRDNQSLIMTDWYNEQTRFLALISGREDATGIVTLDHTKAGNVDGVASKVEGYTGLFAQVGGMFGLPNDETSRRIIGYAHSETDILQMANMYWHKPPNITVENAHIHILGNTINKKSTGPFTTIDNVTNARTNKILNSTLDAFRKLGSHDLALNFCISYGD